MAAPSATLFFDLAPQSDSLYPATAIIHNLIQHVGIDVCSFRRNSQISYRLVELSRDLYEEINKLIDKVDRSGDWDDYDRYSQAIDPLEQILLDIVSVTHEEQEEYLVTGATVQECLESIDKWVRNRNSIRACFDNFKGESKFQVLMPKSKDSETEIMSAYAHDDRNFLHSLMRGMDDNMPKITRVKIQNALKNVRDGLESILDLRQGGSKQPIDEELSTFSIKCAMITYGVTQLMLVESISRELFDHLREVAVWKAAEDLIGQTYACLESGKLTLAELQAEYDKFINLLMQQPNIEMPKAYYELVKLFGKIGRAYYHQSILLLSLCRKAGVHFESKKDLDLSDALESAFKQTIEALHAAAGIRNQIPDTNGYVNGSTNGNMTNDRSPSPTGESDIDCPKLFKQAADELKVCFEAMGLNDAQDVQAQLESAESKDNERVQQVKEKLGSSAATSLVSVTVNVHDQSRDNSPIANLTYNVPPQARLGFIKWSVAKKLPDPAVLNTSKFEKADANQSAEDLSLETKIESLATDNKCTLYLVIGNGGPQVNGRH